MWSINRTTDIEILLEDNFVCFRIETAVELGESLQAGRQRFDHDCRHRHLGTILSDPLTESFAGLLKIGDVGPVMLSDMWNDVPGDR